MDISEKIAGKRHPLQTWTVILAAVVAGAMALLGPVRAEISNSTKNDANIFLVTASRFSSDKAPCIAPPKKSTNRIEQYRFLLEVDDPGAGPWTFTIQTGRLEKNKNIPEEKRDQFRLTLDHATAKKGMRVITPILNLDQDKYCISFEGDRSSRPVIRVKAKVTDSRKTRSLSIRASAPGRPENYVYASEIWKECVDSECLGLFEAQDPFDYKKAPIEQPGLSLWPDELSARLKSLQTPSERRDQVLTQRLQPALESIVYLRTLRYDKDNDGGFTLCIGRDGCDSRCTGFFVTQRLIATNAHCLFNKNAQGKYDKSHVNAVYGWTRSAGGGAYDEARSPDLQHLTPIFVGKAMSSDYALLWVEDENFREGGLQPDQLPKPVKFSADGDDGDVTAIFPSIDQKLTIFGYPAPAKDAQNFPTRADAMIGSFDDFCRNPELHGKPHFIAEADGTRSMRHLCDTEGGASGSPVFDRALDRVLAIHWGGFVWEGEGENGEKTYSRCSDDDSNPDYEYCTNMAFPVCALRDHLRNTHWIKESGDLLSVTNKSWQLPYATEEFDHQPLPGGWPYSEAVRSDPDLLRQTYVTRAKQVFDILNRTQFKGNLTAKVEDVCRNECLPGNSDLLGRPGRWAKCN